MAELAVMDAVPIKGLDPLARVCQRLHGAQHQRPAGAAQYAGRLSAFQLQSILPQPGQPERVRDSGKEVVWPLLPVSPELMHQLSPGLSSRKAGLRGALPPGRTGIKNADR